MEWDEEQAEKIVRKHKSWFSLKFTFKIIRVLIAILLLFTVYKMGISILYDRSDIGERTELYQKLAIDWQSPELSSSGISGTKEISSFGTQKMSFPIEKRIGRTDYVISQLTLQKPIVNAFTMREINELAPYDALDEVFSFDLPYDPHTGKRLSGITESAEIWSTLDKLHEGNVANLALSTVDYYAPKDMIALLSPYDVDILWMPLYMGEFQGFSEGGWTNSNESMTLWPQWGLSGAREVDQNGSSLMHVLDEETIAESEQAMLKNMENMLGEDRKLAEILLDTGHLQERVNYLENEGFQAYGAVITGPVKELLKLQELEGVRNIQLGEIKHWNW